MYSSEILSRFWKEKLERLKSVLEKNNFEVIVCDSLSQAKEVFFQKILPDLSPESISFGGSLTVVESGIYAALKQEGKYNIIDTYDWTLPRDEFIQRRRQALLCDLYLTGTNAITMDGTLVNLDGFGNRVAAMAFGPKNVCLFIGRNKVVADVEEARKRIKTFAAPVNTMRLDRKNPCSKALTCMNCNSPERICNVWLITEKCFPPGRIKVILINDDCGI